MSVCDAPRSGRNLLLVGGASVIIGALLVIGGFCWHMVSLRRVSAVIVDSTIALSGGRVLGPLVTYEYTVSGIHCRTERVVTCTAPGLDVFRLGSALPVYVSRSQPCTNYPVCPPRFTSLIVGGGVVICIGVATSLSWWSA